MTKTIDFNNLSGGTIVDNEFQSQGVTVQAWTADGVGNRAMIFDSANPTGGDHDLETNNLGNVLIISEDGDSHDPDDNFNGGTFRFSFHEGADVKSLTFLDNEEGATVRFYNEHGQLIATRQVLGTVDNGQQVIDFNVDGAYTMDVQLHGSGAVDNLVFDDIETLDGTVEGTAGDDLIDANYDGDPDGDFVDNNDAILAGDVANDDLIYGFGGNDSIEAGDGDDLVFGGTGDDTIDGGAGDDTLCGNDGDDSIHGGAGNDILEGMNDNDVLFGGQGNDSLFGDAGDDEATGGSGDDLIKGGSGNDVLVGDGDDQATSEFLIDWDVLGSDGNQTLTSDGQSVNVSINTPQNAQGKEWFVENGMLKSWDVTDPASADLHFDTEVSNVQFTLLDVDGLDKITIMAKDAHGNLVEVDFEDTGVHAVNGNMVVGTQTNNPGPGADNNAQDVAVTIQGPITDLWIILDNGPERDYSGTVAVTDITFEIPGVQGPDGDDQIHGGDGNDIIFGNGGDDLITGDAGNDEIDGGAGNDSITGGTGDDEISGGDGNDFIHYNEGADVVFGGAGDDTIDDTSSGETHTASTVFGGEGNDTIWGSQGGDLLDGGTGNDRIDGEGGDDTIKGQDGNDVLFGGSGEDKLFGGAGNDEMWAGADNDHLEGGSGNDWMHGQGGDDVLKGGSGDDMLFGEAGNDMLFGGTGSDVIKGGDGDDKVEASFGEDEIFGGAGNDDLWASSDNDTVFGGAGEDKIDGGQGDDTLYGDDGDDSISGGSGADDIFGGAGDDEIFTDQNNGKDDNGQPGADVVFGGADADTIFANAGDTVDGGSAGNDHDVLDITGQGPFIIAGPGGVGQPVEDSNGNGFDGQIIFVDADGNPTGDVLDFTEIEEIIGEELNLDPDAVNDTFGAGEDDQAADLGNVLGNDSDPNGDDLTVTSVDGSPAGTPVTGSDGGLVTINEDGSVSFDPNGDFEALGEGETAETTVTYTVSDGEGGTDTATVTITVTGTNDGPVATDNSYTVSADEAAGDVDGNAISEDTGAGSDSDVDDDQADLTVSEVNGDAGNVGTVVAGSNGGLFTINADGTIDFDANGDFDALALGETAQTSVTYTVTDPDGLEDTATVNFTINGTNEDPIACPDLYIVTEDEGAGDVDGNVITNPSDNNAGLDIDPDGDTLTVVGVNTPDGNVGDPVVGSNGGVFTIQPDGSFDFNANGEFEALAPGETAETSVTYTVSDGNGGSATTTLTIQVNGVNDGPDAVNSSYIVDADEAAGDEDANAITDDTGEGADSDPEDDPLTVVAVDGDAANVGGVVAGDNGGLFTINADGTVDFDANDEFDGLADGETASTTVTYTIADPDGLEDTATVTFTVTGANDGPIAVEDTATVDENNDPTDVIANVLDNDEDPDGDPLTVSEVNGDPAGVGTPVDGSDGGLVTINPDGSVTFNPNGDFDNLDEGETATTTVTYTVTDPSGAEATETVTITVTGTNDAPTAVADVDSTDQDTAIILDNVLGNDTDPEDDPLTVSEVNGDPANVGQPIAGDNGGLITINDDGTASFDPNGEFDDLGEGDTAETQVTYTIVDDNGLEDTTTVTITVTGGNDGPTAVADTGTTDEDTPTDLPNVLGNDEDPDGDDLTVGAVNGDTANVGQPVAGDNGGLVTIGEDGTASFDPNGDFESLGDGETAETTVTYTVTDPSGAESTTTVTVTVTGVNDAPNAVDSAYVVAADEAAGDEDANAITDDTGEGADSDPEDDPLTVVAVDGDAANVGGVVAGDNGGLFTINADGTVDFDANDEFDGLADGETASTTVTYTIADPDGLEDTATVTFTVTGANDGPIAVEDTATVDENNDPTDVIANVLDNDSDPDGDPLTVSEVNGDPAGVGTPVDGSDGGLVTINPDGTVTFDPNGDFENLDEGETATTTVTYTVTDPSGAEATETVTITVTGTNDAPTAVADVDSTDQDTAIILDNVLGNDTDPEDDPLTVSEVNGDPANVGTPVAGDNGGLITINDDGTASFDPNGEFDDLGEGDTAETQVTYTIVDDNGLEDTTTVTITVTGGNDGPTAVADTFDANEDDVVDLGNVLDNDDDPDGDPLTVSEVNGDPAGVGTPVPADNGGLVTINPDGTISFDPNGEFDALAPGETAETTVTYTVTDPSGATDTETVTITVNGVNDGPDATDNAYVVNLTETAGDVDGNVITEDTGDGVDSDPEDDALTVVAVDGDAANVGNVVAGDNGGTFTINADGTVDFDAGDDFDDLGLGTTRDSSVTYTIEDENGATDTATVTFTVTGINDGTVQGTEGDDIINPDIPFVDADGDIVDAGDGILPGDEGTDNDVIEGFGGNDSISAGAGSDDVFGGDGNDTINGNQGDDNLFGGQGEDTINGGLGNDDINGGAGDDQLNGQDGDDTIAGGAGDDIVNGGAGDDELRGGSGNDTIEGSEGEDTLFGGSGDDDLWGGLDDDTVIGGAGNDTVAGEGGDDELHGGLGDDTFFGGTGNDVIEDREGSDTVDAGDGDDIINVGSTQGDEAPDVGYPTQPSATIPGVVFPGYDADEDPNDDKDFVDGGAGNDIINTGDDDDSIIGGSGNDTINAGFDDDTVDGGTGDDLIEGGEGNDEIEGGDGDDLIFGGLQDPLADAVSFPDDEPDGLGFQDLVPENNGDEIFGGAGNDTIFGQDDDDTLFGGTGDDVLDGGVDDDIIRGDDGNDVLIGGQGNDDLIGGLGDDTLFGDEGDDTLVGSEGDDTLIGGQGADLLRGLEGDEVLIGDLADGSLDLTDDVDFDTEDNIDTIFGAAQNDNIFGGDDADLLFGGDGDDNIDGGVDDDFARGGEGDDTVFGGQGDDDLGGNAGNDVVDGGIGDDTVVGGDGDDTLLGGDGDDLIFGGEGVDEQFGGFGSDTFFGGNGGDVVTGGEDPDDSDIDVLDLTGSNVERIDYVDGDPEAGTVTFQDGSTMTFSEIENVIPCFTPGTLIATPKGERLVEELQVGDRIITRDNGIQEIAWLGHKPMSGQQLVQNPHLQPVLIKRGSLGHGLPERDMMVSPNHRVLVSSDKTQLYFEESEVLAAAKHMVGAEGIHTVNVMQTTYVHFMFERHEVVLSNGAWTESFQPGDYSLKGIGNSQRNEIFDLFPELQSKSGLENYQSARKALKKHEAKLLLK